MGRRRISSTITDAIVMAFRQDRARSREVEAARVNVDLARQPAERTHADVLDLRERLGP